MRGAPTELDWEAAGWSRERPEEPDVADEDLPSLASIWSPILLLGGLAALATSAIVLVPVFLFARGLGSLELWPEQSSACEHPDHDLHLAAASGNARDVRSLVADGADVDANEGGWTPLSCAVDHGRPAAMAALLDAGADPDLASGGRPAPIAIAAGRGDGVLVRELLGAGADPTDDAGGTTALHQAAEDDRTATLALLLGTDAAIDLDVHDEAGVTPLALAVWEGADGAVAALLDAGADPDTASEVDGDEARIDGPDTAAADAALAPLRRGRGPLTALHVAARRGDADITRRLLEAGADPNAVAYGAYTPLHVTAALGPAFDPDVEQLPPGQPEVDESLVDQTGYDPVAVTALLLLGGADPTLAPNPQVGTPADLAAALAG